MKFGIEVLQKTLSKEVFHEDQLGDSHTLPRGICEFLPITSICYDQFG
jgi:hypothetical protein